MKGYRTFDWRFFVALGACLMVAYLVVGGYQDNVRKGQRIDALISGAQADQARASQERQALLANQTRIIRVTERQARRLHRLERRQARLLAYLRDQGIAVPQEFTRTGNRPGRHPRKSSSGPGLAEDSPAGPGNSGDHANPKAAPLDDLQGAVTDLLSNLLKGTP